MFPRIETATALLAAVEGAPEFRVIHRPGFFAVDYLYMDGERSFGSMISSEHMSVEQAQLRRECRGIKFNTHGEIIARPYHKFFNYGQLREVDSLHVDWSRPHLILDKLDGSMIHSVLVEGDFQFMTRKGVGDVAPPALDYARHRSGIPYERFCRDLMLDGFTPMFEWCSRLNTIVIDHPVDQLILTGVRHMIDGSYMGYEQMQTYAARYGVPVVKAFGTDVGEIDAFVARVKGLMDAEGFIVRFLDTGEMLKFKADDYLRLHGAKSNMSSEKHMLSVILNNAEDDLIGSLNLDSDRQAISGYAQVVRQMVRVLCERIDVVIEEGRVQTKDMDARSAQKHFAMHIVPKADPLIKAALFKVWGGGETFEAVVDILKRSIATNAGVETYFSHMPKRWMDFYANAGRREEA